MFCPLDKFKVHLGQLAPDVVGKTHFGGFSDDEDSDDEVCLILIVSNAG